MGETTLTFERLEAWQFARSMVKTAYELTRSPGMRRDHGLSNQLQRAGVSVMSNLAEGYERVHLPEKLQFYNVARASAAEVRSLTYVAEDNYPEQKDAAVALRDEVNRVGRLTSGLIASTEARRSLRRVAWLTTLAALGSTILATL